MFSQSASWVWDFWLADDGTQYHLYYLHAPRSLGDPDLRHAHARVGHATSADLRSWDDHGSVLGPGAPDAFDRSATWTGSVVRDGTGVWRMFYTGADIIGGTRNIETIGVATSTDLHSWTKGPGPVLRADPRWYEKLDDSTWPEEAWRDPWVFRDPVGDTWHMLITARARTGPVDDRGVIGHATSTDLARWTVQPPLSSPGSGYAHLEVPQAVMIRGRPRLIFSCPTTRLSARRQQRGETGGVWALAPDNLTGPYRTVEATVLDDSVYSGRTIQDRDGRWVLLGFRSGGDGTNFTSHITDPTLLPEI